MKIKMWIAKLMTVCMCASAIAGGGLGFAVPQIPGTIEAQAATQAFGLSAGVADAPKAIGFQNGSFEDPGCDAANGWEYIPDQRTHDTNPAAMSNHGRNVYVPGWNADPMNTADESNPYAHYIEIQKAGASTSYAPDTPDGLYYAELNADTISYLYQICATVPGTRVYYDFYHHARVNTSDTMSFHLGDEDDPIDDTNKVISCTDGLTAWGHYSGVYTIPEGQEKTKFAFASDSGSSTAGNLIDDVSFKTGAYVLPIKTSDRDGMIIDPGDVITYTIELKNYGEIDASQIVLSDVLGDDVTFIPGSVTISGASASDASFDDDTDTLTVDFNGIYVPGAPVVAAGEQKSGPSIYVTYQVAANIPEEGVGNTTHIVKNQAKVQYNDRGYEDLPENRNGYVNYSNITQAVMILKPLATGSIAAYKVWDDEDDVRGYRPESIQLQLYRDEEAYGDPVTVTAENADPGDSNVWIYIWDVIDEIDTSGTGGTPSGGGVSTPSDGDSTGGGAVITPVILEASVATAPDALSDDEGVLMDGPVEEPETEVRILAAAEEEDDPEIQYHTWKVEEVAVPSRYTSTISVSETDSHQFMITNKYSYTDGGSSGGGTTTPTKKPAKVSVKKELVSGDETPGSLMEYRITVSNEGEKEATGIRIRDYAPKYTHFDSCDSLGKYGVIDGREHVTWFIPTLGGGDSVELTFNVSVDYCVLSHISNSAMYEVTNSLTAPPTNDPIDPEGATEPVGEDTELSDIEYLTQLPDGRWVTIDGHTPIGNLKGMPKTGESDMWYIKAYMLMTATIIMMLTMAYIAMVQIRDVMRYYRYKMRREQNDGRR